MCLGCVCSPVCYVYTAGFLYVWLCLVLWFISCVFGFPTWAVSYYGLLSVTYYMCLKIGTDCICGYWWPPPNRHQQSNKFKWFMDSFYVRQVFDVKMDVSMRNATTQVMDFKFSFSAVTSHLGVDIRSGLRTGYL